MLPDLTQYAWIAWLGLVLIFLIIELLTFEFTCLMLAAGSLGGLGASLLGLPWWLQILLAGVLAVSLLLTIRPLLLKKLRRGEDPTPSNIDALRGMAARVVHTVDEIGGQVKLANGETWSARLAPGHSETLEVGHPVSVTAIHGSTAVVAPAERTSPS